MKKIISVMAIFLCLTILFSVYVYAAPLGTIDITTDKTTVHPGETVKINVNFGQDLGSYTVDVAYDNNLLEYVSAEGGTPNDNGTRVRVYFFDTAGGTSPRNNMSVTFKAKEGITTSNPTDLSVTMEGLANNDASVSYDDVTVPIVKNIVVEPVYEDYSIELNYSEDVIENVEKDMKLVIRSAMGKNYEHTRIIGEVTTPANTTAKLLATDSQSLEHDILESGWGDASGDPIGGKDVVKELDVRGLFSGVGEYTIKLSVIDRDNSDAEIASNTFKVNVVSSSAQLPPEEPSNPEQPGETEDNEQTETPENPTGNTGNNGTNVTEEKPEELPKTGSTMYLEIVSILVVLSVAYIALRRRDE